MNKKEVSGILKKEKLANYNFFENRPFRENETIIQKVGEKVWNVFVTSEKGNPEGRKTYFEENQALEDFVERARVGKRLRDYFKE